MLTKTLLLLLFAAAPLLLGVAPRRSDGASLDDVAEEYVRLVLAVGRHDPNYVDAYYGPPRWKEVAGSGDPRPVAELRDRAVSLLQRTRSFEAGGRREFLEAQLVALEAFLRRLGGDKLPLDEEAQLLYDLRPPVHTSEEFEAARARLEELLPGPGELPRKIQELRARFTVPSDRLQEVVNANLRITRARTAALVDLPEGEAFRVSFVTDKPWTAYNWYQGGFASLIEVNTDLPTELRPLLGTIAHEGYPGHHTYNALLEARLVRGRGWKEYMVYPLYSPQSLLAEGTANAGLSVLLSDLESWKVVQEELAPLAGVPGRDFELYARVLEALRPLRYVRGEAARMLLDDAKPDEEVAAFLVHHGLVSEERARKSIDFIRTYRSYVFNYTAGEDLVRSYIGDGPDRVKRYFDLLQRPATPSGLQREIAAREE